jgi:antitoxin component HigA of HigAB toxin-antitoxin module
MIKIENKQQYYSAMAEIESYLQKGFANLSAKEDDHLEQLSKAVEAWEINEYPMPMYPSFKDILTHIMNQRQYTQTDFSETLSISKSLLSEILNGNKQPNLDVVVNLYKRFNIDAEIILQSVSVIQPKNDEKKLSKIRYGKNPPSKNAY